MRAVDNAMEVVDDTVKNADDIISDNDNTDGRESQAVKDVQNRLRED